jgi:hypothetical protein
MEDVGLLNIFDWKIVLFLFGPISMMIFFGAIGRSSAFSLRREKLASL